MASPNMESPLVVAEATHDIVMDLGLVSIFGPCLGANDPDTMASCRLWMSRTLPRLLQRVLSNKQTLIRDLGESWYSSLDQLLTQRHETPGRLRADILEYTRATEGAIGNRKVYGGPLGTSGIELSVFFRSLGDIWTKDARKPDLAAAFSESLLQGAEEEMLTEMGLQYSTHSMRSAVKNICLLASWHHTKFLNRVLSILSIVDESKTNELITFVTEESNKANAEIDDLEDANAFLRHQLEASSRELAVKDRMIQDMMVRQDAAHTEQQLKYEQKVRELEEKLKAYQSGK
ncbi:uncharacterized protein E0L32_007823 [Thyridium curvatum]|uniref:Uncharacterized protein n=1 Tax=Thyridium curvatum TaxID=1093900 RepID=A0A507AY71_9PEZI|nr:uncharacterized protein E0L32_007823 [Thyridium curvatum]TPX11404.1 hypothetical protein E0L32_007823 [Thyridium curvatum]